MNNNYRTFNTAYGKRVNYGDRFTEGEFAICKGRWNPKTNLFENIPQKEREQCCKKACGLFKDLKDCYYVCLKQQPYTV